MRQPLEELKNLILTDEEYTHTPYARGEVGRSYIFEVTKDNKKITYFGAWHTNKPDDPQFVEIERMFREIEPDIVYIEGWPAINQEKEAIRTKLKAKSLEDTKREGESHFTLKLGVDAGIDFESPEPKFSEEIMYLLSQGFSKENIFKFYMYREIDQYQRMNQTRSIEACGAYLKPYFQDFRQASDWKASELDKLEQEVLNDLAVDDQGKYGPAVDPIPWTDEPQTVLNEISRQSNNFRDRYIFERIADGLKNYDRLFVVYGSGHAVVQEPALRALVAGN